MTYCVLFQPGLGSSSPGANTTAVSAVTLSPRLNLSETKNGPLRQEDPSTVMLSAIQVVVVVVAAVIR